jgi:hypothetical protein
MKYIITESRINEILTQVIEHRYKGIEFKTGKWSVFGFLPHHSESDWWSLVYEKEDIPESDRMVLWINLNDYKFFSGAVPLSDIEIKNTIKDWFYNKTGLKADLVYIQ